MPHSSRRRLRSPHPQRRRQLTFQFTTNFPPVCVYTASIVLPIPSFPRAQPRAQTQVLSQNSPHAHLKPHLNLLKAAPRPQHSRAATSPPTHTASFQPAPFSRPVIFAESSASTTNANICVVHHLPCALPGVQPPATSKTAATSPRRRFTANWNSQPPLQNR